jgi:lipid-binding SYLF domain-containing protein
MPPANVNMESIIARCNTAIDVAATSHDIPADVWDTCKGVAIITVSETGFVFSVAEGDGVVMKKNDDGTWGAPSALKLSGTSAGVVLGHSTNQIFLFPMTDLVLTLLSGQTSAELTLQLGAAAGPLGHKGHVETAGCNIRVPQTSADTTYVYTFKNGAMINIGFTDYMVNAVKKVNADFYGKDAEALDIVMTPGTVEVPTGKGVEEMHEKLASFSMK